MALRTRTWIVLSLAAAALAISAAAWQSFNSVRPGTLPDGPADALIVFGSPTDISGSMEPMQLWRVDEAVQEYRRGRAKHLVFAGGPTANRFVEADSMAEAAVRMGVPRNAILRERHSHTTLENLRNVTPMLIAHGWTRAEFISSADHLPRIAVLAENAPFQWRLHAAPTPGRGRIDRAAGYVEESVVTLVLRVFGTAAEPLIHAVAWIGHKVVFAPKWVAFQIRSRLQG